MNSPNEKNAIVNLLRLVREQRDAIHELRLLLGAVTWMVSKDDPDAMREINEMIWRIDQARPQADIENDEVWEAWLLSVQREVERGYAEISS